jgi:uridine kinase
MDRAELIQSLAAGLASLEPPHPLRVAIDGVDAAGKTTIADDLAAEIERLGRPVIRASIDGFHNPSAIRYRRGPLSPEGYYRDSFNIMALNDVLLQPLGPGGSKMYRRAVFDAHADQPVDAPLEQAAANAILILDGIFLHRPEIRVGIDFSIFVQADFDVTVARAERRDAERFGGIEEARRRYRERYVPGQQLYLRDVHPERLASIVINNNDPARPFVDQPEKVLPRWAQIAAGIFIGLVALVCFGGSIVLMVGVPSTSPILLGVICVIMIAVSGWVLARCVQLLAGRPQAGGWLTPAALQAAAWMFLVFAVFGVASGYVAEHLPVSAFQVIAYISLFFGLRRLAGRRSERIASQRRAK